MLNSAEYVVEKPQYTPILSIFSSQRQMEKPPECSEAEQLPPPTAFPKMNRALQNQRSLSAHTNHTPSGGY